jgi:uncharacterized protein (UPF0128 family)
MNKYFLLTVPVGSQIIFKDNSVQILNDVPDNALELWQKGSDNFILTRENAPELLSTFSKEDLQKVLEVRKTVGFAGEISTIENFMNGQPQTATPAPKPEVVVHAENTAITDTAKE